MAYGLAKTFSKTPDKFGTGHDEGIVASEAANNANVGGALIPLVTMGIPGSPMDAILLGALILHKIQPGPLLFTTNADLVWAIMAAYLIANLLMFVMMYFAAPYLANAVNLNRAILYPAIFVFCLIGAYSMSNRLFDVGVVLAFGIIGFLLEKARVPLGPFVIGYVLAGVMETELRSGLQSSQGSFMPLISRPISLTFVIISGVMLFYPLIADLRKKRKYKVHPKMEEATS